MYKNKKGQVGGLGMAIIGLFLTLAVVGVLQIVTVLTISKVDAGIDQDSFTAEQNTTVDNLRTSNLDALELGGTAQIVLAATIIIFAVFGMVMVFRGRG